MGRFTAVALPLLPFVALRIRARRSNQLFRGACQNVASSRFEPNKYWFIAVRRWDPSKLITLCVYVPPSLLLPVAPVIPPVKACLISPSAQGQHPSFQQFVPFPTAAALPPHPRSAGFCRALLPNTHGRLTCYIFLNASSRIAAQYKCLQCCLLSYFVCDCMKNHARRCISSEDLSHGIAKRGRNTPYRNVLLKTYISLQLSAGWSEQ